MPRERDLMMRLTRSLGEILVSIFIYSLNIEESRRSIYKKLDKCDNIALDWIRASASILSKSASPKRVRFWLRPKSRLKYRVYATILR